MDSATWGLCLQQMLPLLRQASSRNLQVAQQRQKRHYDVGRVTPTYAEGTKVLVYFPIRRRGLSESLMHRWIGPFTVIRAIKSTTYLLRRDSNGRFTSAHVARIKPYATPSLSSSTPPFPMS